jgi:hypothetical protein
MQQSFAVLIADNDSLKQVEELMSQNLFDTVQGLRFVPAISFLLERKRGTFDRCEENVLGMFARSHPHP